MRKIMSFALGVVVGTIVATAWAKYPTTTLASASATPAAAMSPFEMMTNAGSLPIQDHVDSF
jgi:hypothetical protein